MSIFILRPRSEIFSAASWVFLRKNLRALWGIFHQGCWERRSCHTNDDKWRGDGLLFFSSSSIVFVAANCTPEPNGNNVFNGSICIALWERKKHETTRWQRICCSASHSSALQVLVAVLSGSVPHCSLYVHNTRITLTHNETKNLLGFVSKVQSWAWTAYTVSSISFFNPTTKKLVFLNWWIHASLIFHVRTNTYWVGYFNCGLHSCFQHCPRSVFSSPSNT